MGAVVGRHGIEIEIEFHSGMFFAKVPPLPAEGLIGVDHLISGDRIGDALNGDIAVFLAVDPIFDVRESFV